MYITKTTYLEKHGPSHRCDSEGIGDWLHRVSLQYVDNASANLVF